MRIKELFEADEPASVDYEAFGKALGNALNIMAENNITGDVYEVVQRGNAIADVRIVFYPKVGPFIATLNAEAKKVGVKPNWTSVKYSAGTNLTEFVLAFADQEVIDPKAIVKGLKSTIKDVNQIIDLEIK